MPFTRNVETGVVGSFLWWALAPMAGAVVDQIAAALGLHWYSALMWVLALSVLVWAVVREVSKRRLRVLSAHYGVEQRKYWDVTTAVRTFVRGNRIDRKAHNDTLMKGLIHFRMKRNI